MTDVITVVGPSGAGKTTFIERALPQLKARGLSVASVKHASHGFEVDRPGSDSYRHLGAGADPVVLIGPAGTVRFSGDSPGPDTIVAGIDGVDLVLVEGFIDLPGPKVVVHRSGFAPRLPADRSEIIVALTDEPLGLDNEVDIDDVDAVVDLLAQRVSNRPGPTVTLSVDGVPIELGGFVARTFIASVDALVGVLSGVSDDRRVIDLQVRLKD